MNLWPTWQSSISLGVHVGENPTWNDLRLASNFVLHINANFHFLAIFNSHWNFQECNHHVNWGKVVLCFVWTLTKSWSPFQKMTSPMASPTGHTCDHLPLWPLPLWGSWNHNKHLIPPLLACEGLALPHMILRKVPSFDSSSFIL